MENDVVVQVQNRLKALLFDDKIISYREHENFLSESGQKFRFLFWKLQPNNWDKFCKEVDNLCEKHGYQFVPGACDVSTFEIDKKIGYKVMAFYKPEKK